MATDQALRMTVEEYLAFDLNAERRHEFIDGDIREVSGASHHHIVIAVDILLHLGAVLDLRQFEPSMNEMRVRIPGAHYYYPDVVVSAVPPTLEFELPATLIDPLVVIECLSPSTAHIDRGEKLHNYRLIPSLTDYLIVFQDEPRIEQHFRQGERWERRTVTGLSGVVSLLRLDCELPLARVYRRVFA